MPFDPFADIACGRCHRASGDELCWFCQRLLCVACWDEVGHCGHEEADLINRLGNAARLGKIAPQRIDELIKTPLSSLRALVALAEAR